mmetsp:Transcript_50197/g.141517  ORF Transcript_50197/g.141517 Transcript_50197/m.141517 type:complete len:221 (-) Transcript_50197:1299-1961(-)
MGAPRCTCRRPSRTRAHSPSSSARGPSTSMPGTRRAGLPCTASPASAGCPRPASSTRRRPCAASRRCSGPGRRRACRTRSARPRFRSRRTSVGTRRCSRSCGTPGTGSGCSAGAAGASPPAHSRAHAARTVCGSTRTRSSSSSAGTRHTCRPKPRGADRSGCTASTPPTSPWGQSSRCTPRSSTRTCSRSSRRSSPGPAPTGSSAWTFRAAAGRAPRRSA